MLSRRISLLRAYLASLPPSYLSDASLPLTPASTADHPLPLNHTILRSISATLARINILSPPDSGAFTLESQQESSDVQLVALLSSITNSVSAAKDFGRKSYIVDNSRHQNRKGGWGIGGGMSSDYGNASGGFFDTIMGGSGGGGGKFGAERWG
jgi:COP9 signalosome complex subunit 6